MGTPALGSEAEQLREKHAQQIRAAGNTFKIALFLFKLFHFLFVIVFGGRARFSFFVFVVFRFKRVEGEIVGAS